MQKVMKFFKSLFSCKKCAKVCAKPKKKTKKKR